MTTLTMFSRPEALNLAQELDGLSAAFEPYEGRPDWTEIGFDERPMLDVAGIEEAVYTHVPSDADEYLQAMGAVTGYGVHVVNAGGVVTQALWITGEDGANRGMPFDFREIDDPYLLIELKRGPDNRVDDCRVFAGIPAASTERLILAASESMLRVLRGQTRTVDARLPAPDHHAMHKLAQTLRAARLLMSIDAELVDA